MSSAEESAQRNKDRRSRPTRFLSRYSFVGGRRLRGRRSGEGEYEFVDRYSVRLAFLLLIFFWLTLVDSLCTLSFLQKGGREINPIALLLLSLGPIHFVVWKGLLSGLLVMFGVLHKNFRQVRWAMKFGFLFYFGLAVYHLILHARAALQISSLHV